MAAELERLFREMNLPTSARLKVEVRDGSVVISRAPEEISGEKLTGLMQAVNEQYAEVFQNLAK